MEKMQFLQSENIKEFHSHAYEDFGFVQVNAQFPLLYSYGLPQKTVTFVSNAELVYSYSTVDSSRSLLPKAVLLQVTHITYKSSKKTLALL